MTRKKQTFFHLLTSYFYKNIYLISIISILLLSTCIRFYNYPERWGLGNDDSRDIAIAQEAIARHEIPLIGSFSSAGPFVFGPIFYWVIIVSYLILPFSFTAPWIITALFGICTIALLIRIAYLLEGRVFAIIVGVLAMLSPQLVIRSLSLGQHTFIAFCSSLLLLLLVHIYKKPSILIAFLFGIVIGIAINFHYQALNLLVFITVLLFLPMKNISKKLLFVVAAIGGVIIGLFPLLLWDSTQQFANFRNLLDYLLIGQHRIYVPNSWKLFLLTYLPNYWTIVTGGYYSISIFLMIITGISLLYAFFKKTLKPIWYLLLVPFGFLLIVNKFYKGERSEGYLLYLLPLILLVTGYGVFIVMQKLPILPNKRIAIGLIVLFIVSLGNILYFQPVVNKKGPVKEYERIISSIQQKYPDQKFVIYDYLYQFPHISQPFSILLKKNNLGERNGLPLGFTYLNQRNPNHKIIYQRGSMVIVDLSNDSSISAQKKLWAKLSPEDMYDDLIVRWQNNKLQSTFSLQKYIKERLHF